MPADDAERFLPSEDVLVGRRDTVWRSASVDRAAELVALSTVKLQIEPDILPSSA